MKKSGNVTIKLGPNEVQQILGNPTRLPRKVYGEKVSAKLYKAVAEKFSDVKGGMAEEIRAGNIADNVHDSDAWKSISADFHVERQALFDMERVINQKQAYAMEKLIQKAFDEAGIINFKASSYGYTKVVNHDTN